VNYVGGYLGKSTAQHINEREAASASKPSANQEIGVVVSSQDSEGVTQQNFDLNFLKNLEIYTVERVKIKTKEYLASQGYPNADVNFTSEATYVESGPMKLAVIRLRAEGSNQVFIAGTQASRLRKKFDGNYPYFLRRMRRKNQRSIWSQDRRVICFFTVF